MQAILEYLMKAPPLPRINFILCILGALLIGWDQGRRR